MNKNKLQHDMYVTYRDVMKYYFEKARVAGWQTVAVFVFRLVTLMSFIVEPILIKRLIDAVQNGGDVRKWVIYIIFLTLLTFVSRRMIEHFVVEAQLLPMRKIVTHGFSYIHGHGSRFFSTHMSGSLLRRVKDGMYVFENVYDILLFSLITPIGLSIGAIIVLWQQQRILGVALLIWVIVFVSLQIALYARKGPYEEASTQSVSKTSGYIADTFSNHMTIEYSGSFAIEQKTFDTHIQSRYDKTSKNRRVGNVIYAISGFVMDVMWSGGVALGVWFWQQGMISVSVLVMLILYLGTLAEQLRGIGNTFKRVVKNMEDGKEYLKLLHIPHEVVNLSGSEDKQASSGDVDFDKITFGYAQESVPEIQGFSLSIREGEHIGLVGESGAGKSTLTKLLLRLYDIHAGEIRIGGENITSFTLDSLRSQISYVPQEPILFHRSLRENIMYGNPDASEEEMIAAAKRARAHEFIEVLPDGYDSLVGERGVKLSGGQRQRVAIARAILHDAPIIMLDEATSSLDSVTEKAIQEAMHEVMKGKTAIVIAHRLGTVKHLDRLVVLDAGKIIQEGRHEELIQQGGIYAQLWEHQV